MPLYDFKCSHCDHELTQLMSIAQSEDKDNLTCPECNTENSLKKVLGATRLADSHRMGLIKPPREFRDLLKTIHKNTPGSKIPDRW